MSVKAGKCAQKSKFCSRYTVKGYKHIFMRHNNCGEFSECIDPILNDSKKGKKKIEQIKFVGKSLSL